MFPPRPRTGGLWTVTRRTFDRCPQSSSNEIMFLFKTTKGKTTMTSQSFTDDPGSPNPRPCGNPGCDGRAVERSARNGTPYWECEKEDCGFEDYRPSLSLVHRLLVITLTHATHAAGVPEPPEDSFLSQHDHATQNGLDPKVWTLHDGRISSAP